MAKYIPVRRRQRRCCRGTVALIALAAGSSACTFDPTGSIFDPPLAELTDSGRRLVFEDEGTIGVFHGYGCARSDRAGEENFLRVRESLELPDYATAGTVFLNGWHLQYLEGDHDLRGLGTGIARINLTDDLLQWEAGGAIGDRKFDDGYQWCYYYTAVVWNDGGIAARVDEKGSDDDLRALAENLIDTSKNNTTALKVLPRLLYSSRFSPGSPVAVLPRGMGVQWLGGFWWGKDHNLLQLGYNLDYTEPFFQQGKGYLDEEPPAPPGSASVVDSGYVSWDMKAVFKDNKGRRDYAAGELVSLLGGRDVGVIQPPFSFLPREDIGFGGGCISGEGGVRTQEYVVENLPFDHVVPMLTGWELAYGCDDENVAEIGIWISDFRYDKPPDEPAGTLHYTLSSILRDKDSIPEHMVNHRVSLLGIKPVAGGSDPVAEILNPHDGDSFDPGTPVALSGTGVDPEDGPLPGTKLQWFSDRDGFLGSGDSLEVTLSGAEACDGFTEHTLVLRVTDSDGRYATQRVKVLIGRLC